MIPSKFERREPPLRPRSKELGKKITQALALLRQNRWSPGEPMKLKHNLDEIERECGIETALKEDQQKIFVSALLEIKPDDYAGSFPPEAAYESSVSGQDLWEFRWDSPFFGNRKMYFKFAISKGDENSRRLFILSIHPNRPI